MAGRAVSVVFVIVVVLATLRDEARAVDAALSEECSADFQKVVGCLNFATGKAGTPTKECCASVTEMRASSPKCLCFIIQQSKNGSQQIKQLGIQTDKLLMLPSACQLKNTSVSECPKLLGLAANSPDAAIFTNATTTPSAPTTSSKATPTTTTTPAADQTSGSDNLCPFTATGLIVIAVTCLASYYHRS